MSVKKFVYECRQWNLLFWFFNELYAICCRPSVCLSVCRL